LLWGLANAGSYTIGENIFLLIILCTGGVALLVVSFVLLFIHNQHTFIKNKQKVHDTEMMYQKDLMNAIIQSQEAERKRIGQDLHDEVGGSLSNLRMLINRQQVEYRNQYNHLIDKIIQDVRNISHNLSPPALELFGFSTALEELKDIFGDDEKIFISITHPAKSVSDKLPYNTALALLRILQELIANTLRHANADKIIISVFIHEGVFTVRYEDDGVGFDQQDISIQKGMGMRNIRSRIEMINAGHIIKTASGKGFSLSIFINPA
jgi:signal transduction histidine kinase